MSKKEKSTEYNIWSSFRQRCTNPKDKSWGNYGGRGITVCERWHVFKNFLADMGPRPPGYQLDRIDNDGGYQPGNCRWTTSSKNNNNKRTNRRITYLSKTQTTTEWARELGMRAGTIRLRLRAGWPLNEVFSNQFNKEHMAGKNLPIPNAP